MIDTAINSCRDLKIERIVFGWKKDIIELSKQLKVGFKELERQTFLHLPGILTENQVDLEIRYMPESLKKIIVHRFIDRSTFQSYMLESGADKLLGKNSYISNNAILLDNGTKLEINFSTVNQKTSDLIEGQLHYLRTSRTNALAKFGLYISNYRVPICYMSLSSCDRYYKIYSLQCFLRTKIEQNEVIELSRVYGYGDLPKFAISKLVSFCESQIKISKTSYLITAINPYLGFNGVSMRAAGFKPFTYSPVAYIYDSDGSYIGRRHNMSDYKRQKIKTPPNLLLVKGLTKKAKKTLDKAAGMFEVSKEFFYQNNALIFQNLKPLRDKLENVWSDLTIHHNTPKNINDPISKGQCGVTTAFLAKEFEAKGYKVLFCEGVAYFPNGFMPIQDHCWLKIPSFKIQDTLYTDIIIDLTADQNGFFEKIICDTKENLNNRNIFYTKISEQSPSSLSAASLLDRLDILKQKLSKN